MQITNKTFLISGGGSGLGAATAQRLVESGANVVIADVNPAAGESTAVALGAHARFAQTDVTDEEAVQAAIDLARSTFGGLHGAVCCAGIATVEKTYGKRGIHPLDLFPRIRLAR